MKFGEKYELLESLTTGGVETFVANDRVRGERVLVHILECEEQKPNQATVQWVLDAFRHIAPEPAGLVLETGRYSGTLYAYLVTKMPDEAALAKWVQRYKAQGRDTQEVPTPAAKSTRESESPTAEINAKERPPSPSLMTELPRESEPQVKPAGSSAASKTSEQPAQPQKKSDPAADWSSVPSRISFPAKPESTISDPANSFSSAFNAPKFPSEPEPPPRKDGPKPGEFTNFFQGPFRVEGPPAVPAVLPQRAEHPRKPVGEFTAMFNSPQPDEPSPAAGVAGNEPAGSGFTGWFNNPNIAARTSGTAGTSPASELPRSADNSAAFPSPSQEPIVPPQTAPPYVGPTPPVVPLPMPPVFSIPPLPTPAIERHLVTPASVSPSEAATNAFNRPASGPTPSVPALPPSGPSAYTQVISMKRPAASAGVQKEASPNSSAMSFPAASMPSIPAISPPPLPKPPVPKLAIPPAPKAPKAEIPAPPVSYWPLILTLTVLFFIAALLVLYFALKH